MIPNSNWSFRYFFVILLFCCTFPQYAEGCGGTSKPPICGKTMAFGKAPPSQPLLLTDGGSFELPVVVFARTTLGCTSSPSSVSISLTLTCNPGPGASGSLVAAIGPGYNTLMVPITLPAGPPRICTITGTATVTFSDGMMLSSSGDSVVCIVEPSPTNPSLPRLGLELLTPTLNRAHPGDQYSIWYRITNNDPIEGFSGTLRVGIENAAKLPNDLGPAANGQGVYALGDPVGDHPPIYFADQIPPKLCVPLPRSPHLTVPNSAEKSIVLDPGESMDVEVLSRHWGLCSSGTCSESTAVLEGLYADGSPGLGCSGTVLGADTSVPPTFSWPGSGQVMAAQPFDPGSGIGLFHGQFADGTPLDIHVVIQTNLVNGSPVFDGFDYMEPITGQELRGQFYLQQNLEPTDPLNGQTTLSFFPVSPVQIELVELNLVSAAPTGFEHTGPFVIGTFNVDRMPFDGQPDAQLHFLSQTSLVGFAGTAFQPPSEIELFSDGFESGDISAWSLQTNPRRSGGVTLDGVQVYYDVRAILTEGKTTFPCPQDLTADYNADFLVTNADLHILSERFTQSASSPFDRNGDGIINMLDIAQIPDRIGCQEQVTLPAR